MLRKRTPSAWRCSGAAGAADGAAANALDSPDGPVQMIAMADLFENRLASAHEALSEKYPKQMNVPPDRRFTGFERTARPLIVCVRATSPC